MVLVLRAWVELLLYRAGATPWSFSRMPKMTAVFVLVSLAAVVEAARGATSARAHYARAVKAHHAGDADAALQEYSEMQ